METMELKAKTKSTLHRVQVSHNVFCFLTKWENHLFQQISVHHKHAVVVFAFVTVIKPVCAKLGMGST